MYTRSVLVRLAGAIAGGAFWFGLIVLALANFDSPVGVPEELSATWPFWLVAVVVTVAVFFALRRLGKGPGWPSFLLGFVAPFLGLLLNAQIGDGGGLWLWVPIVLLILVPLPQMRSTAA